METKIAVALAINTATFLGYLFLAIFILVKLRCGLDKVSLVSMVAALSVLTTNFACWLVYVLLGYGAPGVEPPG